MQPRMIRLSLTPALMHLLLAAALLVTVFLVDAKPVSVVPSTEEPHVLKNPLLGARIPPSFDNNKYKYNNDKYYNNNGSCKAGAICVTPKHDHYPIGHEPGVLFTSRFQVPQLPKSHNSQTTTYYDYYNIFWRQQPVGGYMNQFVPQLMLGNVLANSSNYPDYDPQWLILDQWHIGAQYFFALPCNDTITSNNYYDTITDDDPCWIAKAATGKLVPVNPGETIETTIELIQISDANDWEWQLRMGVVGAPPERWSLVVARQPFMGLVPNTKWQDAIYQNVTVGSCLENYGMTSADNYPKVWEIAMGVITPLPSSDTTSRSISDSSNKLSFAWDDWVVGGIGPHTCSWMPHSTISNVQRSNSQRVTWTASIDNTENDNNAGVTAIDKDQSSFWDKSAEAQA